MSVVLITDPVHPVCNELLAEAGMQVRTALKKTDDELAALAADADAWIVRSGTRISARLLEAAPNLKVVGRAGVGVDNVDVDAATHRGVLVLNAPEGNTISTAEHTVAMLLSLARHIPHASASLRDGKWDRKSFTGAELFGKTLGVVGAGKIGRTVAERLAPFGMTVLAYDPLLSVEAAERSGILLVGIDEIIARCDFITVHTPLTDATRGLFNRESIARCKPGVRFVNCARGGIIDEADLLEAIEAGHVAGAALDVYSMEPPTEAVMRLVRHDHVVATPHIAASTDEAQEKVARQVTEEVIRALRDEPVLNAVNGMAIRMAASAEVKPFLDLAERMGTAARQMAVGQVTRVLLRCHGDVPRRYAEVLLLAALKGLMSGMVTGPVNLVNAKILADETGLRTDTETFLDASGYLDVLELVVSNPAGTVSLAGSLSGAGDPRLVRVDDFQAEVRLDGHLLFYRNADRPGMLAKVGSILAGAGVNIAGLALGRRARGGVALTVIGVDERVPDPVLITIAGVDGVESVRRVEV